MHNTNMNIKYKSNSYFVSTVGDAPLEGIKQYIENQKTSQRQKDKLG